MEYAGANALRGFHWITPNQFLKETEKNFPKDISYFVEVDLDYPSSLHDLHNDYPFCAESMTIDYSLLLPEQRAMTIAKCSIVNKLMSCITKT